jgi:hypothetical protein
MFGPDGGTSGTVSADADVASGLEGLQPEAATAMPAATATDNRIIVCLDSCWRSGRRASRVVTAA